MGIRPFSSFAHIVVFFFSFSLAVDLLRSIRTSRLRLQTIQSFRLVFVRFAPLSFAYAFCNIVSTALSRPCTIHILTFRIQLKGVFAGHVWHISQIHSVIQRNTRAVNAVLSPPLLFLHPVPRTSSDPRAHQSGSQLPAWLGGSMAQDMRYDAGMIL